MVLWYNLNNYSYFAFSNSVDEKPLPSGKWRYLQTIEEDEMLDMEDLLYKAEIDSMLRLESLREYGDEKGGVDYD